MLRDGSDLTHLEELDPKLWVALAMPTRGVHFDPKMLDAMDTDKDGRARLPEVLDAVRWSVTALRDPNDLVKAGDSLPLEAIKDVAIVAGAKQTLENLGKPSATSISLADVSDTAKIFAETKTTWPRSKSSKTSWRRMARPQIAAASTASMPIASPPSPKSSADRMGEAVDRRRQPAR